MVFRSKDKNVIERVKEFIYLVEVTKHFSPHSVIPEKNLRMFYERPRDPSNTLQYLYRNVIQYLICELLNVFVYTFIFNCLKLSLVSINSVVVPYCYSVCLFVFEFVCYSNCLLLLFLFFLERDSGCIRRKNTQRWRSKFRGIHRLFMTSIQYLIIDRGHN